MKMSVWDEKSLKGRRIALVLSGGGAKGAYQIGMLRALEEAGLEKEQLTMAGTSIGALNALMYAVKDLDAMRAMIHQMNDMTDRVEAFAKEQYPDALLLANRIPVTVCAYCVERERPEYFHLWELTPEEQRAMTIASASLDDLLPPVAFLGCRYLDGGKIPVVCSPLAAAADKIPLQALTEELTASAFDLLLISYLKPEDSLDLTGIQIPVLESWPSEPLEDEPGTGTRDYSSERLEKNERMGYEETKYLLQNTQLPGMN